MREIKFRAWDKDSESMIYPDAKENSRVSNYTMNAWCDSEGERTVLEQFTGLYDKKRTEEFPNGQPIYEGDIVKRTVNMRHYAECDGIVVEKHRVFYSGIEILPFSETSINMDEFEVIGNVHENKELS